MNNHGWSDVYAMLGKYFVVALFLSLVGCSNSVSVVMPINASETEQVAVAKFVVKKQDGYRVALLFVWSDSVSRKKEQRDVLEGRYQGRGVSLPIHLRITRGSEVFFDEVIMTVGVSSYEVLDYEGVRKSVAVRDVKHFGLPPGAYSLEVRTVGTVTAFQEIESYVELSSYDPKI